MNFYNPFMSAIQHAQSIAGGMPFSQVVQPGMSFSPQFPMGDRVIPSSPGLPPIEPPVVTPPNIPPVGIGSGNIGGAPRTGSGPSYGGEGSIRLNDVGLPGGPMPFDLGKSVGPLDFLSLLPPTPPPSIGLPPIQPPSNPLPDLSGGLMNTMPSDLGEILSLI